MLYTISALYPHLQALPSHNHDRKTFCSVILTIQQAMAGRRLLVTIDGFHGAFYHGNWRALHHHAAC